jgi:hypothetical protein
MILEQPLNKTRPGNLVGATSGLMVVVGGKGPNATFIDTKALLGHLFCPNVFLLFETFPYLESDFCIEIQSLVLELKFWFHLEN